MRFLFFIGSLLCSISLVSQTTVTGTVHDMDTGDPLVGAYIISPQYSAVSDVDGGFSLAVESLPITATISYIGFDDVTVQWTTAGPHIVTLQPTANILDIMTVTGSRYEQRLSESTVSVEVLKPDLIRSVNTVDIDAALDKVPGVQMVDGQANIRGGSGYSYGAGSRVMLLIDDMPALQVDAGFPNWGDIPVENIAQVEVLKGAASALYGSSALNGIINIRTGIPTATPRTEVSAAYTTFGNLPDSTQQWYGDTTRYQYNVSLLHKQKFGKLDLVLGGFITKLESFNRFTFQNRLRGNVKLQYQLSDKAFIRLNTLVNSGDNGDFFIWSQNGGGSRYEPFMGNTATSKNFRYFIDPSLHIEDTYGNTHKLLTRYHYINNENNNDQGNTSRTMYGEYQVQRQLEDLGVNIAAGAVAQVSNINAELLGDTTFVNRNYATYLQVDKKLWDKLNVSGGLRYEYNEQQTPEEFNGIVVPAGEISEGRLIARAGTSYEYAPFSAVRASWGQGYRFPTITEKFITTTFGGFNILPNPALQSESGWTAELGVKQAFKLGNLKGYVDLAYFVSEYQDMTEFTADLSDFNNIGFQSLNVGDTRIQGADIGIFTNSKIGKVDVSLYGGYTYLDPKYQNFEDSILLAGLSTDQNFLKYRVAHNSKWDLQLSYKGFTIGGAVFYNSHVVNIDSPIEALRVPTTDGGVFLLDLFGVQDFREENNNGYVRLDLRAAYTYKQAKVTFLVNNVLNEEYTNRPGLMEAPINYSVRLDYGIDWK